jgi:MerR family transcriptional regulator/heat shock protein HspR
MNTEQDKLPLFTISVAAKLIGCHPRTLMTYEREGLIIPHRTQGKRRLYSKMDLKSIAFLKFLTREKGINLSGAKFILEAIKKAQEYNLNLKKTLFPEFKTPKLV